MLADIRSDREVLPTVFSEDPGFRLYYSDSFPHDIPIGLGYATSAKAWSEHMLRFFDETL